MVVTPTNHTRPAAVTEVSGFWQSLGGKVTTMSPAEHDQALAMTSHLPHLVAVGAGRGDAGRVAAVGGGRLAGHNASGRRRPEACGSRFSRRIGRHVLDALDAIRPAAGGNARNVGTRRRSATAWNPWKRRQRGKRNVMLWEIDIHPAEGQPDRAGDAIAAAARELGLADELARGRGARLSGARRVAGARARSSGWPASCWPMWWSSGPVIGRVGESPDLSRNRRSIHDCVTVLLKPGVMDPVAQSALAAAADLGISAEAVATLRKYWLGGASDARD